MSQLTERPTSVAVLNDLFDYLLSDPATAYLVEDAVWGFTHGERIQLTGQAQGADPQLVLARLQGRFGAEFVPDNSLGEGWVWHELRGSSSGVRVRIRLAAPDESEAAKPSHGAAVLEATRYRAAQLDEQRHQIFDAAVPPVLVSA